MKQISIFYLFLFNTMIVLFDYITDNECILLCEVWKLFSIG